MRIISTCVCALLVAWTGSARAEWKIDTEYVPTARRAQIRVVSSSGALKVKIADRIDSAPLVVTQPNSDGYVPVEITSPSGQTYRNKIEVRRDHETKLTVRWIEPRYRGTFVNTTNGCGQGTDGANYKFVIDSPSSSTVVPVGRSASLELPPGTYQVRLWKEIPPRPGVGSWVPDQGAKTLVVRSPGWRLEHGCGAPMMVVDSPTVKAGQSVSVRFPRSLQASPNEKFWLTTARVGAPDSQYGLYVYLMSGSREGKVNVGPPGEYEVRLHGNYPTKSTNVVFRARIRVTP